jgi:hypothetical protein
VALLEQFGFRLGSAERFSHAPLENLIFVRADDSAERLSQAQVEAMTCR